MRFQKFLSAREVLALAVGLAMFTAGHASAQTKVLSPLPESSGVFGFALAAEGDTVVVGSGGDASPALPDTGQVFIITRATGGWVHSQRIISPVPDSFGGFGRSVDISGNTIVVGAPTEGAPGNFNGPGNVYIYTRDAAGVWQHQATIPRPATSMGNFGLDVAIDGDTIVVASPLDGVENLEEIGSAYVFVRTGTSWSFQQRLVDPALVEYATTPHSIDIRGDTIAFGAAHVTSPVAPGTGMVRIYERTAGVWNLVTNLHASDGRSGDSFGATLSFHGNTLAVGAPSVDRPNAADSGAAYVFIRTPGGWVQQARLNPASPAANDFFGSNISAGSNLVVVGADRDDTARGRDAGTATVFAFASNRWTRFTTLSAADGEIDDYFGSAVAIASGRLIVGAYSDDYAGFFHAGSVYIYDGPRAAHSREPVRSADDEVIDPNLTR